MCSWLVSNSYKHQIGDKSFCFYEGESRKDVLCPIMYFQRIHYSLILELIDRRRIVGVAHVEDFESITDPGCRADCERRALDFAKMLLKERRKFQGIADVISAIQKVHT